MDIMDKIENILKSLEEFKEQFVGEIQYQSHEEILNETIILNIEEEQLSIGSKEADLSSHKNLISTIQPRNKNFSEIAEQLYQRCQRAHSEIEQLERDFNAIELIFKSNDETLLVLENKHTEKIELLSDRLKALNIDKLRMKEVYDSDAYKNNIALKKELDELNHAISRIQQSFLVNKEEIDDSSTTKELTQQLEELAVKVETKAKELAELDNETLDESNLISKIEQLKSQLKEAKDEVVVVEADFAQSSGELAKLKAEKENMNQQFSMKTEYVELIRIKLAEQKENNDIILPKIKALQESIIVCRENRQKLNDELLLREAQSKDIRIEINAVDEYISSHSEKPHEDLDALLKKKEKDVNDMSVRKKELQNTYKEELKRQMMAIMKAEQQTSQLQQTLGGLKEKIEQGENLITELKTKEEHLLTDTKSYEETLTELNQAIKIKAHAIKKFKSRTKSEEMFTKSLQLEMPKPVERVVKPTIEPTTRKRSNWDSDGSVDIDYTLFRKRLKDKYKS